MRKNRIVAVVGVFAFVAAISCGPLQAQEEDREPKNLQFFPPDMTRDSLMEIMRGFSFALGVRCQYCHTGGDGVSFDGVVFENDDDPDKRKARYMLRMVQTLNRSMLPLMADRDEPSYEISCKTCHRGQPKPVLLTDVMRRTLDEHGTDSAQAKYRSLRESVAVEGMYDFGEWEVNVLAERLAGEGREEDAIAIYELNREYFPESPSIALNLAGLYERTSDIPSAIASYERVLEIVPRHRGARARLEALRGG